MRKYLLLTLLVSWFACAPLSYARGGDKPVQVSLQLLWKHQFQFAGYYVAQARGYYRDAGLEVEIREFSNNVDLVRDVLLGTSDFAVGRSSLLVNKANGDDIVALLAAYQKSPLMLLSKRSNGISAPTDLKGRRVMITNDAKQVVEVMAMLLQAGLHPGDFTRQPHSFNLQDLIDGRTDAMASYISNEPYQLQRRGIPYNIMHPADYGFSMYSDILFTSRNMLEKQPELTYRFYLASMKGWQYALEHIEETAELIHERYNSQKRTLDALRFEGEALKKLAYDEMGQFGTMTPAKFDAMANLYLVTGTIKPDFDLSNFIYDPQPLMLSQDDRRYLDTLRNINVCGFRHWSPYEAVVDGRHQGLVSDYINLLSQKLGLSITLMPSDSWSQSLSMVRSGLCDLVPGTMATPQRSRYLGFSRPYLHMPAVIAIHDSSAYGETASELADKRLAVRMDSAFYDILSTRYPNATLVAVNNVEEGLSRVAHRDVFGFIDAPASIGQTLQQQHMQDITLYNTLSDQWDLSLAVRLDNEQLLELYNRAIRSLTPEEHQKIANRWLNISYTHKVDYSRVWQAGGALLLLLFLMAYRYWVISGYNRKLEQIAQHDALTGIYNRHKLYELLDQELKLVKRYERPGAVVFFDLDNFKQINDVYGHNEGDRVLRTLAELVRTLTRETDYFGRWGGEEFLVILPETDRHAALMLAEKLRQAFASYPFGLKDRPVTCSFGVTQILPDDSIESLMARADTALYAAKEGGRNCIRQYPHEDEEGLNTLLSG